VGDEKLSLNESEADLAKEIAERYGISEAQAASQIIKDTMARRMKKNTGHRRAKVLNFKRKA
jgi:hypothetical protein